MLTSKMDIYEKMTVGELIEKLNKMPKSFGVEVSLEPNEIMDYTTAPVLSISEGKDKTVYLII